MKKLDYRIRLLMSFLAGIVISAILITLGFDWIFSNLKMILLSTVMFVLITVILILYINSNKENILASITGTTNRGLNDVGQVIESIVDGIESNDTQKIRKSSKELFHKGTSFYVWITYRKWVVTVLQALFLGFGSLLGTFLLFNQNALIEGQNKIIASQDSLLRDQNELFAKQNIRLDQQTYLQEAQRRSSYVFLLGNVMDAINEELKLPLNTSRNLSRQLLGQIISLSHRLEPYRYLEGDDLSKFPLSPERGQLLIFLIESGLSKNSYSSIFSRGNFTSSDIGNYRIENSELPFLDLSNSRFNNLSFVKCNIHSLNLHKTIFNMVSFLGCKLEEFHINNATGDISIINCDFNNLNVFKSKINKITIGKSQNSGFYFRDNVISKLTIREAYNSDINFNNDTIRSAEILNTYADNFSFSVEHTTSKMLLNNSIINNWSYSNKIDSLVTKAAIFMGQELDPNYKSIIGNDFLDSIKIRNQKDYTYIIVPTNDSNSKFGEYIQKNGSKNAFVSLMSRIEDRSN